MGDTHEVLNQVPPLEGYNLFLTDPVLDIAVAREGAKDSRDLLVDFGERAGSEEYYRWGFEANRNEPQLVTAWLLGLRGQPARGRAWIPLRDFGSGPRHL